MTGSFQIVTASPRPAERLFTRKLSSAVTALLVQFLSKVAFLVPRVSERMIRIPRRFR